MTTVEERLAALEGKVKLLEAREAIRQLITSYGPLVDTANDEAKADLVADTLWTEDGFYEVDGYGRHTGRAAIAASFHGFHFDLVRDGCAHVMGLPYIRVEGDRATALAYSCVFRAEGERFFVWRVAANEWNLICVDGKWQVETRTNCLLNGAQKTLDLFGSIHGLIAKSDRL